NHFAGSTSLPSGASNSSFHTSTQPGGLLGPPSSAPLTRAPAVVEACLALGVLSLTLGEQATTPATTTVTIERTGLPLTVHRPYCAVQLVSKLTLIPCGGGPQSAAVAALRRQVA